MGTPQNEDDLVQYVAALNWMRNRLPLFAEKAAPLQDLLAVIYKEAKEITKKKGCVILWHDHSSTRAPPGPTRSRPAAPTTSITSGRFRGSKERWTIPEKEAFAVIEAVTKHNYLLLAAEQFSLLPDHFTLKYMYAPLSLDPSLARHTVSKIQRCALKQATYNYRIENIAGELNVWTDLLTRWGAAVTKTTSTPRNDSTLRYGSLFLAPLAADDSDNEFPVASEVLRLQKAAARNPDLKEVPPTKRGAHGLLVNDQGKIWIPTNSVRMQVRLCVIADCGRAGHRDHQVTLTGIQDH
jgi:RNase H-like domain found in reverse transcriptase